MSNSISNNKWKRLGLDTHVIRNVMFLGETNGYEMISEKELCLSIPEKNCFSE